MPKEWECSEWTRTSERTNDEGNRRELADVRTNVSCDAAANTAASLPTTKSGEYILLYQFSVLMMFWHAVGCCMHWSFLELDEERPEGLCNNTDLCASQGLWQAAGLLLQDVCGGVWRGLASEGTGCNWNLDLWQYWTIFDSLCSFDVSRSLKAWTFRHFLSTFSYIQFISVAVAIQEELQKRFWDDRCAAWEETLMLSNHFPRICIGFQVLHIFGYFQIAGLWWFVFLLLASVLLVFMIMLGWVSWEDLAQASEPHRDLPSWMSILCKWHRSLQLSMESDKSGQSDPLFWAVPRYSALPRRSPRRQESPKLQDLQGIAALTAVSKVGLSKNRG